MELRAKVAVTLLLCLVLTGLVFAGTVGKMSGFVLTKRLGLHCREWRFPLSEPPWERSQMSEGKYFILNVPAGRYDLKAKIIGYAPVELKNMNVSVDLTSKADFQLSSKVLDIGETQIVLAERPMIIKDQTASLKLVSKEEVQQMPTRGYQDVVGLVSRCCRQLQEPADVEPAR